MHTGNATKTHSFEATPSLHVPTWADQSKLELRAASPAVGSDLSRTSRDRPGCVQIRRLHTRTRPRIPAAHTSRAAPTTSRSPLTSATQLFEFHLVSSSHASLRPGRPKAHSEMTRCARFRDARNISVSIVTCRHARKLPRPPLSTLMCALHGDVAPSRSPPQL